MRIMERKMETQWDLVIRTILTIRTILLVIILVRIIILIHHPTTQEKYSRFHSFPLSQYKTVAFRG